MKYTDGGGNGAIEAIKGFHGSTGGVTLGYDDSNEVPYIAQVQETPNLFNNYSDVHLTEAQRTGSLFG